MTATYLQDTENTFTSSTFEPGNTAGIYLPAGHQTTLVYNAADDSVLFDVTVVQPGSVPAAPGNTYLAKWSSYRGFDWIVQLPGRVGAGDTTTGMSQTQGNYWLGQIAQAGIATTFVMVAVNTGEIVYQDDWTGKIAGGVAAYSGYFDGSELSILTLSNNPGHGPLLKALLNRQGTYSTSLAEMYADICQRVGFTAADYDVSDLQDVLQGVVINRQDTAANILDNYNKMFLVNCVERDYKLVFEHRGKSVQAHPTQNEMIRTDAKQSEPYIEKRIQEIELPARVSVSYKDINNNYQIGTQHANRVRLPRASMQSSNFVDLQLAASTSADVAKAIAEHVLWTSWNNRHTFQFRLPWTYLWLDAGDAINVTFSSGYSTRLRMGNMDVGVDLSIDTTAQAETSSEYVSLTTTPVSGSSNTLTTNPASNLLVLDVPLLQDTDENTTSMVAYLLAGPMRDVIGWPGAEVDVSQDGSSWTALTLSTTGMAWGTVIDPPVTPHSAFRTQFYGTMTVFMATNGALLSSVTDDQLANGANGAAVLKSNGAVEVIQFRDVTQVSTNQYQLSWLNRGRRGTDTMMRTPVAAGDSFVLLNTAQAIRFLSSIDKVGKPEIYRAFSSYELPEAVKKYGVILHGRDKMPYAPTHVNAALSGSDIVITWVRRTRFNGGLVNGTDQVPLNEASESYQIDILTALGGTVLRTLTSTTTSVVYPAASISADLHTTPTHLALEVFQMSAAVGRGFGHQTYIKVM